MFNDSGIVFNVFIIGDASLSTLESNWVVTLGTAKYTYLVFCQLIIGGTVQKIGNSRIKPYLLEWIHLRKTTWTLLM